MFFCVAAMDAYPADYITHNLPLLVLSGLSEDETSKQDSASLESTSTLLKSHFPVVRSERGKWLRQEFEKLEGAHLPWNATAARSRNGLVGYRIRLVGREFQLPPRKAGPPSIELQASLGGIIGEDSDKHSSGYVLHSPLSPLSPESPLYPDGVMTPSWLRKHQEKTPAAFVAFFEFTSDPNLNSLNDNQLKSEISNLKTVLASSGYKTRFTVVLISDKTILEAPDIEERLATIKRGAGLDIKTGLFFLPPNTSRVEVSSFATAVATALQPICIEYYRDLTKHSRRKKNRGTIPQPTVPPTRTTSQSLSQLGWGIRYDFKLGAFAEFRQEMEAACRHYSAALESLLNPDGILETTASWSPRWDDGRLLADITAFRIIRCLLWSQQTTTATQSWINYRDRMRELVDRRGKGSTNYGWEAWEARWAKLMAELIQRTEFPALNVTDSMDMTASMIISKSENTTYMPHEKAIPVNERVPPWYNLHHEGYWMRLSARNARRRRRFAADVPEEDRVPPGRSPASSMAHRANSYDTYLCPEPHVEASFSPNEGFNHTRDITERLNAAAGAFDDRSQARFADRLKVEVGRELLKNGEFAEAMKILKSIWTDCAWRKEKWWLPLFELTRMLHECARGAGDVETLVATSYELHSGALFFLNALKLDLMKCDNFTPPANLPKAEIKLFSSTVDSFLKPSFAFSSGECHIGAPELAQIVLDSSAHKNTCPVTVSKIICRFKGGKHVLEVSHNENTVASESFPSQSKGNLRRWSIQDISPRTNVNVSPSGTTIFTSTADLGIGPRQTIVLETRLDFRDIGELSLESIELHIKSTHFELKYSITQNELTPPSWYLRGNDSQVGSKRIGRETPWSIEVKPKPPKIEIDISDFERDFYTDEPITLDIKIINSEDEEVRASIDVRLLSHDAPPKIKWYGEDAMVETSSIEVSPEKQKGRSLSPVKLPGHRLPPLQTAEVFSRTISFVPPSEPSTLILEAKILYFLISDPTTPLSKTETATLGIVSPFEANYDCSPRVHPDPWPTFFSMDTPVPGLLQRWCLTARTANFVDTPVVVKKTSIMLGKPTAAISCKVIGHENGQPDSEEATPMLDSKTLHNFSFLIDTMRTPGRDQHRTAHIAVQFRITWARCISAPGSSALAIGEEITSSLLIPAVPIPPLEPRAIASAVHTTLGALSAPSSSDDGDSSSSTPDDEKDDTANTHETNLTLTLENPTTHPLTFDISAPATATLTFSGPKQLGVNILPYSRTEVRYRCVPLVGGEWDGKEGRAVGTGQRSGAWVSFGVRVEDRWFSREVSVLAGKGLRSAAGEEGGVRWWVE